MNAATRNHESAHAALAIAAAGWVPVEVRADAPDLHIAGQCTPNFTHHEPDFGWLVAVVGGPLVEGEVIGWRPREDAIAGSDERLAAKLVRYLGLERHHYLDAIATARDLLARDDVRAIVRLIAVALDCVPVLNERQLYELLGPELLDPYLKSNYAIGAAA